MSKYLFRLYIALFLFIPIVGLSQSEAPLDTTLTMEVEEPNKFSFIFHRSILLEGSDDDTAPIRNSSGEWYVGLGFKIPIAKNRLGVRIQPGITWLKLPYDQESETKNFPDTIAHNFQKHRITYADLPIGLYYNITLDKDRNARVFVEAGGFVGYSLGGVHKFQDDNIGQQPVTTKISNIQDIESLRYGIYARLGYKFAALTFHYRLTEVFVPERTDLSGNIIGTNPLVSNSWLGLTIFL